MLVSTVGAPQEVADVRLAQARAFVSKPCAGFLGKAKCWQVTLSI